jgi:hypothetical protein
LAPTFWAAALPVENVWSALIAHPAGLLQQGTSPPASTPLNRFAVLRI